MQLSSEERRWLSELNQLLNMGKLINIRPFPHALTNHVYLLTFDNQQSYIFKRLNKQARNQQQRARELRVQKLASDNGLTPKLLASCDDYRLQAYFPGKTLDSVALDNQMVELLAAQLQIVHQLPPLHAPTLQLASELQLLKKQILKKPEKKLLDESKFDDFLQLAKLLDNSCAADVLCHGDLSFNNIIVNENGQIQIVDWEYAAIACAAYDLATCSCVNELSVEAQMHLIEHYYLLHQESLSRSLTELKKEFALYHSVFTYLNELWSLCFLEN